MNYAQKQEMKSRTLLTRVVPGGSRLYSNGSCDYILTMVIMDILMRYTTTNAILLLQRSVYRSIVFYMPISILVDSR